MKRLILAALLAVTVVAAQETTPSGHQPAPAAPAAPQAPAPDPSAAAEEQAAREEHGVPKPAQHAAVEAAHAGEGHEGEKHEEPEMPNEIWWKWANFAILVLGLGYLIGKNAGPFFTGRSAAITQGIAEATKTREEAEAKAAEIERRVSNLSAEVEQMRKQSREEIAREGDRIRTETEASLRKLQTQAQNEIESAAKHAMHDVKAYSAKLALDMAEQQLREQMSRPAQDGLTAAFVSDLRRKAERN